MASRKLNFRQLLVYSEQCVRRNLRVFSGLELSSNKYKDPEKPGNLGSHSESQVIPSPELLFGGVLFHFQRATRFSPQSAGVAASLRLRSFSIPSREPASPITEAAAMAKKRPNNAAAKKPAAKA